MADNRTDIPGKEKLQGCSAPNPFLGLGVAAAVVILVIMLAMVLLR